MTTYPLPTLAAAVTPSGIAAPTYGDVFASLQASYRGIFGPDVYLEPDSQDGQFLAIVARAVHDANAAVIAAYNAFSPSTAQGEGLSRVVKINGLRRLVASLSTVDLVIIGTAGTTINGGIVADAQGIRWLLPSVVIIPVGGTITVTASADGVGAISASAGSVNRIVTPMRGWVSASNPAAAVPGAPVETDATLRQRQSVSAALPAQAIMAAIAAAVGGVAGVQRYRAYQNDGAAADANGIPGHSIALVVSGGDSTAIARAIAERKTPGTGTYGSIVVQVIDSAGVPNTIRFSRPALARVRYQLTIKALPGYVSATGDAIRQALVAYVNAQGIGTSIYLTRAIGAADLGNQGLGASFYVTALLQARDNAAFGGGDIPIGYSEAATLDPADIALTVI